MPTPRLPVIAALLAATSIGCSSSREDVGTSDEAVDLICSGKAKASIDGIPAYAYCGDTNVYSNNGVDTRATGGTGWVRTENGYGYQCVEFAVRYMHFKWNVPAYWGVSYAKQMCGKHPAGVSVTTHPVHGDLAVFDAGSCGAGSPSGHVAVVDTVGSTSFVAVQENTAGKYTYKNSCALCFLHATSNAPADAASDAADDASNDGSADDGADGGATEDANETDAGGGDAQDAVDAGAAPPSVGGCSSAPRPPSNAGWIALALGLVIHARRRRGR